MDQLEFLHQTLGASSGFLETVTLSDPSIAPQWHRYPLTAPLQGTDIGFRPVIVPQSQYDVTENGLQAHVVAATVDADTPLGLMPSVFVLEGGSGRRHAYWKLGSKGAGAGGGVSYLEVESLRRQLDPLGQPATYFPLPETVSTKYAGPGGAGSGVPVEIEPRPTLRSWDLETIKLLEPTTLAPLLDDMTLTWAPDAALVGTGVQFYLASRVDGDAAKTIGLHLTRPKYSFDRLITELIEQGDGQSGQDLELPEIIWICCRAASNPYLSLGYGQTWETARHVARVAATFSSFGSGILKTVQGIRRRQGRALDKYTDVSKVVISDMEKRGLFLHAINSTYWYIDHESGEPIELGHRNERLQILINRRYGVNASTLEHRNCIEDMITHAGSLPRTAEPATLSYYRDDTRQLWVHFGGREVGVLSAEGGEGGGGGLSVETNGHSGLIFRLPAEADPIVTAGLRTDIPLSWWDEFLPPGYFVSLTGTEPAAASAVMRVWAQFVLFREYAHTRPLLAFLGPINCLAADTPITVRRKRPGTQKNSGRTYSIADLYSRFRGEKRGGAGRQWQSDVPTEVLSLKDGLIYFRRIKDVIYSGENQTFTVKVHGKEAFRATKDHRFLTSFGYKRLHELNVGDEVLCRDMRVKSHEDYKKSEVRRTVSARYHPHARQKSVAWESLNGHRERVYPTILYCRAALEARQNNLTVREFLKIVHHDEARSKTLTYLPSDVHIHHKDEDPLNDYWDNLQVLPNGSEHIALHFSMGHRVGRHRPPVTEVIESIEPYGIEPTYDITMEDQEAPNFLVNDVIVHNSGKSTFAERFYSLFYGARKNVTTIRSQEEYDTHTSNNPFIVFDNIDRCPHWLPSALETSITPREQDRRKLFTDNTMYHIRCDAIVGLTAHDPTIFREGIIDRLLVLNFRRLDAEERIPASTLIQQVTDRREYFLSGLLSDALRVLKTPRPVYDYRDWEAAIRIMDFMDLGGWIASALGILPEFKEAIIALAKRQTSLIIEGEEVLVDALDALKREDPERAGEWMNGSEFWNALSDHAPDAETFTMIYKTPAVLGIKIAGIYTQLKEVIGLELLENQKTGRRHWRIRE